MPTDHRKAFALKSTQKVFREVWDEFCTWEESFCKDSLASLDPTTLTNNQPITTTTKAASGSTRPKHHHQLPPPPPPPTRSKNTQNPRRGKISKKGYIFTKFTAGQKTKTTETIQNYETYICQTTTEPSPPYEACTYSHKNLYNADDSCDKLSFMPFSDSPDFPAAEYLQYFDQIGWDAVKDPDLDVIVAEVVRRLHFEHGLSFKEIDETECLPIPIIEERDRTGLLHILNERDTLIWPGASSHLPPLPQTENPPPKSLRKRVNGLRYLFCPNLNCLEPYCPTHLNMHGEVRPKFSITHDGDLSNKNKKQPACGSECYKNKETSEDMIWDDVSMDDFKFILSGAADLSSCDLAVVCDRPCYEVYHQRRKLIPENPSRSNKSYGGMKEEDESESSSDEKIFDLKYVNIQENAMLQVIASVIVNNYIVIVIVLVIDLVIGDLKVVDMGRECDPELCQNCEANTDNDYTDPDSTKCRNNGLQHGRKKAIEVKQGAYGLGLFLTEPAKEGDLIGEYVGEIINSVMTDARGAQSRYLGRNYLFALNSEWTIDAAFVGNETRFINHASGNQANCRAEALLLVREVNGDHRIDKKMIQPGEELMMDYGDEYFTANITKGTPRAGGNTSRAAA